MTTNSPGNTVHKVLGTLTTEEIKRFLVECANLPNPIDYPEHRPHFERWLRRWTRLFTFQSPDGKHRTEQVPREHLEVFAPIVRTTLCRLWKEPDARQRDWYCYRLRDAHRQMIRHLEGWEEKPIWGEELETVNRLTDYALQDVPRACPFEAAMFWLQLNCGLMLYCDGLLCGAPYFFRTEKRQRYCSPECADPARRQAKLKWWNENRKK